MSLLRRILAARVVVPRRTFSAPTARYYSSLWHGPLAELRQLQRIAPTFYTRGQDICPLQEPSEFYKELKTRISLAKDRIFIAALYIGHAEKDLIETLYKALERSKTLKVCILVDCLRGTRVSKGESSATLLLPLVRDFPDQVKVSLYHTPELKGLLKKALPQRFNEGIGLMHMKIYGFDDAIMLSGANLSKDYFSNRQDRYMIFERHQKLSSYYHELLNVVGSLSYQLIPRKDGYSLQLSDGTADPVRDSARFKAQARDRLFAFINRHLEGVTEEEEDDADTAVLPVIQMGPFNIRQDEQMTLQLLSIAHRAGQRGQRWMIDLTSGYFNFTNQYKSVILHTMARFRFLTAAPEANGFFNSKGVSRFLPPAYTWIEKQFYGQVKRADRLSDISIEEYKRPGWTYHAKGLWATLSGERFPMITMIGSPNFGHRSSRRDLEAQALVITQNKNLQEALHKEVERLHAHSELVTADTFARPDRRVPYGVRAATAMIKTML